jgi:copper chaperone CopZ
MDREREREYIFFTLCNLSGNMAAHIINMAIQTFTPKKHVAKKVALSPPPRYPAMPRYPPLMGNDAEEIRELNLEILGMECAACAGSIEKSVKRLQGIEDATVAVLQNRAQVIYHPAFIDVSPFFKDILDGITCASPSLILVLCEYDININTVFSTILLIFIPNCGIM